MVSELAIELAVQHRECRYPDRDPSSGFHPLPNRGECPEVVVDVFEHVDHHGRTHPWAEWDVVDDAVRDLDVVALRETLGENGAGMRSGLDGMNLPDVRERGGEGAVTGTDLQDRGGEVGPDHVHDPLHVIDGVIERIERRRQRRVDLVGVHARPPVIAPTTGDKRLTPSRSPGRE